MSEVGYSMVISDKNREDVEDVDYILRQVKKHIFALKEYDGFLEIKITVEEVGYLMVISDKNREDVDYILRQVERHIFTLKEYDGFLEIKITVEEEDEV